jgi:prepilin-type N-terminal cleavage/methylation domain-containing protein
MKTSRALLPRWPRIFSFAQSGFTLLELIITFSLMVLMAAIAGRMMIHGIQAFNFARNHAATIEDTRAAVTALQRDLRQIRSTASIVYADGDSLDFYSVQNQQIKFASRDGIIWRNQEPLLKSVMDFELHYYDAIGTEIERPITNMSLIWRVGYSLTVDTNDETITLGGSISPRNF